LFQVATSTFYSRKVFKAVADRQAHEGSEHYKLWAARVTTMLGADLIVLF